MKNGLCIMLLLEVLLFGRVQAFSMANMPDAYNTAQLAGTTLSTTLSTTFDAVFGTTRDTEFNTTPDTEFDGALSTAFGTTRDTEFDATPAPAGTADTAHNRVSGNVRALDTLFREWVRLERGETQWPVAILQLGDSHVQAGFFPARVRNGLQKLFGDAGRGLIAPLRLAGTNEPSDYVITSPGHWASARCIEASPAEAPGLTGIALSAESQAVEFTITAKDAPFDRIRVFHHREAPLAKAQGNLADDLCCPLEDSDESTLVPLRETVTSVTLRAEATDPKFRRQTYYGFSLENGNRGILYHSMGINGNTFTAMNRNPQIVRQAVALQPQLIIVSLGTNDSYGPNVNAAAVGVQIEQLIGLIRKYFPLCPLLLTTPMECGRRVRVKGRYSYRANPHAKSIRDQIVHTADRHGLPVWDFFAAAGGEGAMKRWNTAGLTASDHVHLVQEGYRLQGDLLCAALVGAYNDYKTRLRNGGPAPAETGLRKPTRPEAAH